jgi:hypothetical protein
MGTIATAAVPDFPSLVAVIVTEPSATPVTTPAPETVAIAELLEAQLTARPVSTLPLASVRVAVSVPVWPMTMEFVDGETATFATGAGVTVIADDPDFPSLVAVMVAEPCATPVTTPVVDTVATAVLLDAHVTLRLVTTVPFASLTVAANGVLCAMKRFAVEGATVTLPTGTGGGVTVTVAVPLFPSHVAVTVTVP